MLLPTAQADTPRVSPRTTAIESRHSMGIRLIGVREGFAAKGNAASDSEGCQAEAKAAWDRSARRGGQSEMPSFVAACAPSGIVGGELDGTCEPSHCRDHGQRMIRLEFGKFPLGHCFEFFTFAIQGLRFRCPTAELTENVTRQAAIDMAPATNPATTRDQLMFSPRRFQPQQRRRPKNWPSKHSVVGSQNGATQPSRFGRM